MKRVFLFSITIFSLFLFSCKEDSENENKAALKNQVKSKLSEEKTKDIDTINSNFEENTTEESVFIKGYFYSSTKIDTLDFKTFSKIKNVYLDSIPSFEDFEKKVDYIYTNEIEIHITNKNNNPLKFENASSLYFIENIGDNNNDGLDEIAVVVNYADQSSYNNCKIYSYCNNNWKLLFEFSINEMSLFFENNEDFIKYKNSIKDHFEKKGNQWYYADIEMVYEGTNGVAFKKLKLEKCK